MTYKLEEDEAKEHEEHEKHLEHEAEMKMKRAVHAHERIAGGKKYQNISKYGPEKKQL